MYADLHRTGCIVEDDFRELGFKELEKGCEEIHTIAFWYVFLQGIFSLTTTRAR